MSLLTEFFDPYKVLKEDFDELCFRTMVGLSTDGISGIFDEIVYEIKEGTFDVPAEPLRISGPYQSHLLSGEDLQFIHDLWIGSKQCNVVKRKLKSTSKRMRKILGKCPDNIIGIFTWEGVFGNYSSEIRKRIPEFMALSVTSRADGFMIKNRLYDYMKLTGIPETEPITTDTITEIGCILDIIRAKRSRKRPKMIFW